ncbi:MAG: hypothetical protein ACO2ZZ_06585 [Cyclobacteriaceae bacterium]
MKKLPLYLFVSLFLVQLNAQSYFPGRDVWEQKEPIELNLKSQPLLKAVEFAEANEYSGSRDLRIAILEGFAREPYHEILGPTKKRGGPAGLIIKNGYIAASWGDIDRVDMTFSVTKSYLSTIAGLAQDRGFISTQDKLINYVWDGTFDGLHNESITWHHY